MKAKILSNSYSQIITMLQKLTFHKIKFLVVNWLIRPVGYTQEIRVLEYFVFSNSSYDKINFIWLLCFSESNAFYLFILLCGDSSFKVSSCYKSLHMSLTPIWALNFLWYLSCMVKICFSWFFFFLFFIASLIFMIWCYSVTQSCILIQIKTYFPKV